MLFYGTVSGTGSTSLPTPPTSLTSSPFTSQAESQVPELRVHALPLSSDFLLQSQIPGFIPFSERQDGDKEGEVNVQWEYLPSRFYGETSRPLSPKRKRERDIFEEAELARKRAKRKGGEGVSAAAAKLDTSGPPLVLDRKYFSIDTNNSSSRPVSRKGGQGNGNGKREVEVKGEKVILPEPGAGAVEQTVETRNKEALTKVVMAGMRMRGLVQRKRHLRRGSLGAHASTALKMNEEGEGLTKEDLANDEEFKQIYHQTFKGAVLAWVSCAFFLASIYNSRISIDFC